MSQKNIVEQKMVPWGQNSINSAGKYITFYIKLKSLYTLKE